MRKLQALKVRGVEEKTNGFYHLEKLISLLALL
jgi:hypothetical protein